jgi:hypothetical protein
MSEIATTEASPFLTEAVLRDALAAFPHVRLVVTGACMGPELNGGDTVLLVSAARRTPRVGNIVLAIFPSGPRLHRLVWRSPWGSWRTMADNASALDPPVAPAAILGTVIGVEGRARSPRRTWRVAASIAVALWARLFRA